eukprot:1402943-Amphidinium_carterae.1
MQVWSSVFRRRMQPYSATNASAKIHTNYFSFAADIANAFYVLPSHLQIVPRKVRAWGAFESILETALDNCFLRKSASTALQHKAASEVHAQI